MGSTLILALLIIHILLPILSQHNIPPILSACNKGDKLKGHQQLTFEFFSIILVLIDDDRLGGESFSPNESEKYGWKLLYDWLKHENRQYMSKMTAKLPILGGEKLSFLSCQLRLSLRFRLRFKLKASYRLRSRLGPGLCSRLGLLLQPNCHFAVT